MKGYKKINILSNWYNEVLVISSPLNPFRKIERSKIDFIYTSFVLSLGNSFFEIQQGADKPINKTSWLFSLLSNHSHLGCINALYEVSLLMKYSEGLEPSLKTELAHLKKNPENLRTFFFELFIYKVFDTGKIEHVKKPKINNQVLEGICTLSGEKYLFECRKSFLPNIIELDVFRRLMTDIYQHTKSLELGIGMIGTIKLKRPIKGIQRVNFSNKIKQFFNKLNSLAIKGRIQINYHQEDEDGCFSAIDYDEANLIEIKATKDYDVIFYVAPPKVPIQGILNYYSAKVSCNFSVFESHIYKKLERVLKEKKEQHRQLIMNKIIFLDNEILPEFHMNLFQNGMYDLSKVKKVYEKINLKSILCVVQRSYNEKGSIIEVDVLAPDNLRDTAQLLKFLIEKPYLVETQ